MISCLETQFCHTPVDQAFIVQSSHIKSNYDQLNKISRAGFALTVMCNTACTEAQSACSAVHVGECEWEQREGRQAGVSVQK